MKVTEKIRSALILMFPFLFCVMLLIYPEKSMNGVREGLALCSGILVPSLFPFFVVSNLIIESGAAKRVSKFFSPVMRKLFKLPGASGTAFALGLIGGFPVGAQAAIMLYKNGQTNKSETERLLSFCNNSGPAFILGVIGAGLYKSLAVGAILYFAQILSAFTVGILFSLGKPKCIETEGTDEKPSANAGFAQNFVKSVSASAQSMLSIAAFVTIFSVIIILISSSEAVGAIGNLFQNAGIASAETIINLISGFFEFSTGISMLSKNNAGSGTSILLTASILGWTGLCVHSQVMLFLGEANLSSRSYFFGKIMAGILTPLYTAILLCFYPYSVELPAAYIKNTARILNDPFGVLFISTMIAAAFFITIACAEYGSKKRRK